MIYIFYSKGWSFRTLYFSFQTGQGGEDQEDGGGLQGGQRGFHYEEL